MPTVLTRLDEIASIDDGKPSVVWLERIAFAFLVLMVIFAPHSIAATQTAWVIGMTAWIARLFMKPRFSPATFITKRRIKRRRVNGSLRL